MTNTNWPFSNMQIPSSGKLPDRFNSKEKQFVRNKQWLPVFKEVVSNLGPAYIQYICFPSPSCAFIKQLLKMSLLERRSYVVALERSPSAATEIVTQFSGFFERDKYSVISKKYEDAMTSGELVDHFMRRKGDQAGFDILELDFTSSIFSMNDRGESKILDSLIRTLMMQSISGRKQKYYLITSFKLKLRLAQALRRIFPDAVTMLCRNFIARYNEDLSDELINLTDNEKRVNLCILNSIPLILIEHAPRLAYLTLRDVPYVHISRSVGGKTRIASFVFACEYRRPSLSSIETIFRSVEDAFDKVRFTVWV